MSFALKLGSSFCSFFSSDVLKYRFQQAFGFPHSVVSLAGCFHFLSLYCTFTAGLVMFPYSASRLKLRVHFSLTAQDLESAEKSLLESFCLIFLLGTESRGTCCFCKTLLCKKAFSLVYSILLLFLFFSCGEVCFPVVFSVS